MTKIINKVEVERFLIGIVGLLIDQEDERIKIALSKNTKKRMIREELREWKKRIERLNLRNE